MGFYNNIIVVTGTLVLAYLMLKVLKTNKQPSPDCQSSDNKDLKQEDNPQSDLVESDKGNKRKSEEPDTNMKLPKLRPNFFLGFQVYDVGVHQKVKKIQETIIEKNPLLHPALVNVSTLHVTLAVTHLANETDIKNVKDKLEEWSNKNKKSFFKEPIILNFTGIKTFNDAVAYVEIEHCQNYEKLSNLSQAMNDLIHSAGYTTDKKMFTPHLTLLKLSKDFKLVKSKKRFKKDFEFLKECTEHFGKQEISNIQLLSMDQPKDSNGYYKCLHQIDIKDTAIPLMDHSSCCEPIPKPTSRLKSTS